QRSGVGEVLLLALVDRVLRVVEGVVAERQRHVAGEVLDRGDLLEDVGETGGLRDVLTTGGGGRSGTLLPALVPEQPDERGGPRRAGGGAGGLRDVLTTGGGGLSGTLLPALVAEQPVERGGLQTQQIRDLDGVAELREGDAGRSGAKCDVSGAIGARGSQAG